MLELDDRLELLTALQWDLERFLQVEYDALQTKPIEMMDRDVAGEILMNICDRDLYPLFTRLFGDTKPARDAVNKIKEFISLLSLLVIRPSQYDRSRMNFTETCFENVEFVGINLDLGEFISYPISS